LQVFLPRSDLGLRQHLKGKDREIRANGLTEVTVYTPILSFSLRVIIAFEIEGLGHPEDIARTVIDTELAALASLFDYGYPTLCDLNGLQIKWNTPIFHLNPFVRHSNYHSGSLCEKKSQTSTVWRLATNFTLFNRKF